MPVRLLLLVNSSASSVTARTRVIIQKLLKRDHDVEVAETGRRGHAMALARGAANRGVDVIVALGGDGTVNEAANGAAGTATALGVLPGGSTNVMARTLGLPDDPVEAATVVAGALAAGEVQRVGLGAVNGRYFVFHAGLGFDAAVVEQVERRSGLKRYAGHPLFVWAAVRTWSRHYDHRRPRMRVDHPDGTSVDNSRFVVVLNTDPYTYLGSRGLRLDPAATMERGLSSVAVRSLAPVPLLRMVASALGSGRYLRRSRHVERHHDLRGLDVHGYGPFPYQVDGDFLGETDHLRFEWRPDVLSLVRPGLASHDCTAAPVTGGRGWPGPRRRRS